MKNLRILRRMTRYLAREKRLLVFAVGCMIALAATSGVYAFLVGPAAKFLVSGGAEGMGKTLGVIPELASVDQAQAFLVLPALLLVVAALKGVATFGQYVLMERLGHKVEAGIRADFFSATLANEPAFFREARTGDLMARFTSDASSLRDFVTMTLGAVIRDTMSLAVLLGVCFYLDWKLSVIAFVGVPFVGYPVALLGKKLKRRAGDSQSALGRLTAIVQEGLWGVRVVQAYGMEARELGRFERESREVVRAGMKAAKARSLSPIVIELATVLGLACALMLAAKSVLSGAVDSERLMSFLAAVMLAYQPARELGRAGHFLVQALVSAERVFPLIEREPALRERTSPLTLPRLTREFSMKGIEFGYSEKTVLRGFDLTLRQGERVALVGESGAGKSTAALLAMRFADPSAGAVLFDGVDARDATLASVRKQFGLVTQESYLLAGSVAENIALGRPDAPREAIVAAARIADADAFIEALPRGYDTPIGERGASLSGGQKQRIALARALLVDAPILLLDEATSALDPESEREVARALAQALIGRTALVIAHRLSTIRDADRILVIRGGRVVEEGRHAELMERGGEYTRLYRREAALETG